MSETNDARFACLECGKQYRWKSEIIGKRVRCKCDAVFTVPDAPSTDPADPSGVGAAAGPSPGKKNCPSCHAEVAPSAVICIGCGFNMETGQTMGTDVGRAIKTAHKRRRVYDGHPDGIFGRLRRSWEFAKIAYGILWDFKQLVVFPIFSGTAALLVLLSFILPAWGTGTLDQFTAFLDEESTVQASPLVYVLVFAFYLCNYFVIAFFNTALAACAMKVCAGEAPTIGFGLNIAVKRLPQILGWAFVSATVGLILKMIENSNEKVGAIVAAILGTGWTILTYFVVPVLAVEGIGPFKAIKQSVATLKETWGETVLGNFSMALLTFLVTLPIYLILGMLIYLCGSNGQIVLAGILVCLFVLAVVLAAAVSSAADMVFRGLLYNYATGRTIPEEVDEDLFVAAFAARGK